MSETNDQRIYDRCLIRVGELEAENDKLREELADAPKCETCEAMLDCDECLRADGSHKERRRLSAENAKLRELVRDMCKAFIHGPCYRWCEHMPEPCNGDKCQYVRRMHELGVDA